MTYSDGKNREDFLNDSHYMCPKDVRECGKVQKSVLTNAIFLQGFLQEMWAAISLGASTELNIQDRGTFVAKGYVDDILLECVEPFGPFTGDTFFLLHDYDISYTTVVVHLYLEEVGIYLLPVPAKVST